MTDRSSFPAGSSNMMAPPLDNRNLRHERHTRERAARRADILRAARNVFAQRGFRGATLEEIALRAGFGKGTVYNYFRNKADLFSYVLMSLLDDIAGFAAQAVHAGGTSHEIFERFAVRSVEYYLANEDVLRIIVRDMNKVVVERGEGHIRDVLTRIEGIVEILAATLGGGRRADVDPRELARVFFGILQHRSLGWIHNGRVARELDAAREGAFITRLFFDGAAAYIDG